MAIATAEATPRMYHMTLRSRAEMNIALNALTMHGVYVGANVLPSAVRILEDSGIDFSSMIWRYPSEKLELALDNLRSGTDVKAIIVME